MRRVVVCIVAVSLAVLAGAAQASAETLSPWFHVSSTSLPTNLQPGGGSDEVQELSVSATSGEVVLAQSFTTLSEGKVALVPYNVTAERLREALAKIYPERRLLVQEEKNEPPNRSWKITFPDQSVEPVFASGAFTPFFGGKALECEAGVEGCSGEAAVAELHKGEPTGDQITLSVVDVGDGAPDIEATPLQVADALPKGVRVVSMEGSLQRRKPPGEEKPPDAQAHCDIVSVTCTFAEGVLPPFLTPATVRLAVVVEPGGFSGEEPSVASVSGAGGPPVRTSSR